MALIIDGNAVYEIDEDCKKRKELKKKATARDSKAGKSNTKKPVPPKSCRKYEI